MVHNMRRVMAGKAPNATYDGYASCPIVTGRGKLILAEFKYGNELAESQPPVMVFASSLPNPTVQFQLSHPNK